MLTSGIKSKKTFLLKLADRHERSANILEVLTGSSIKISVLVQLPKTL